MGWGMSSIGNIMPATVDSPASNHDYNHEHQEFTLILDSMKLKPEVRNEIYKHAVVLGNQHGLPFSSITDDRTETFEFSNVGSVEKAAALANSFSKMGYVKATELYSAAQASTLSLA